MAGKRHFRRGDEFWEYWLEDAPDEIEYWTGNPIPQVLIVQRSGLVGERGERHEDTYSRDHLDWYIDRMVRPRIRDGFVEHFEAARVAVATPSELLASVPPDAIRLVHDHDGFWQIQQRGAALVVTSGELGDNGQTFERTFGSDDEARAELAVQLGKKQRKGFRIVHGAPAPAATSAIDAGLEQQILDEPDRDELFSVYADWLAMQGDPRGTLASLQTNPTAPQRDDIESAEDKLLWEHRAHFYGSFAPYIPPRALPRMAVTATWRYGWFDTLALSAVSPWVPQVERLGELVDALPRVHSARFLRALAIGAPTPRDDLDRVRDSIIRALSALPLVRSLSIGLEPHDEVGHWWSRYEDPVGELWRACHRMESLAIRASAIDLFRISDGDHVELPALRELAIRTAALSRDSIEPLARLSLPNLVRLELWLGDVRHDAPQIVNLVAMLPKLRHLVIGNSIVADEIAAALSQNPAARRLETLGFAGGHLTVAGVERMVAQRGFPKLHSLDVSRCLLDPRGRELARTLARVVDTSLQEDFLAYENVGDDDGDEPNDDAPRHCAVRNAD